MTTIINIWGGPGCGKSTTASALFSEMKKRNINVEYVTEFAKDVCWEGTQTLLENQLFIFAEQFRRQFKLLGKVDYIVTDSPILLSAIYMHKFELGKKLFSEQYLREMNKFFCSTFLEFDNKNYMIRRSKNTKYSALGRLQNEAESISIDKEIENLLVSLSIPFYHVEKEDAVHLILEDIQGEV